VVLSLAGGANDEVSIVAKLLQPAAEVCGLIVQNSRRDFGFDAKVPGSQFGNDSL